MRFTGLRMEALAEQVSGGTRLLYRRLTQFLVEDLASADRLAGTWQSGMWGDLAALAFGGSRVSVCRPPGMTWVELRRALPKFRFVVVGSRVLAPLSPTWLQLRPEWFARLVDWLYEFAP